MRGQVGYGSGMHKSLKAHQQQQQQSAAAAAALMGRGALVEQQQQPDVLDWLIHEDTALLAAVADYLELPLNLVTS
jgi:hypothetical protein